MYCKDKMVIDLDSTICKTHLWMLEEAGKLNCEILKMFEYPSIYHWGDSKELESFLQKNEQRLYKEVLPFENVAEVMSKLWEKYEICIETSRNPLSGDKYSNAFITTQWLEQNNIPYDNLRMVGNILCKTSDIHLINPVIVIDDEPNVLSECFRKGYYTIKMNHSYNTEAPSHFSVDAWREIERAVDFYEESILKCWDCGC